MKTTILILALILVNLGAFAKDFNIDDFGAKGDGKTLDTQAVQDAINASTANGGGQVVVSSGKTYIIGTIYLKNNVTLYLENGSTLKSTTDYNQYATDTYKTRYKLENT